jgi:uncharacterized small protein (DUF1192 family)
METTPKPLSLIDRCHTRRFVAMLFLATLGLVFLISFSAISDFYRHHSPFEDFLLTVTTASGLCMAFLELKHSGEANEHRAELNRLTEKLVDSDNDANTHRDEANRLRGETLELQTRIHILQQEIERRLTKVRLYARARDTANSIELQVSNLSEFDLWINQVRLVVTESRTASPGNHLLGGGNRISRGHMEGGYQLYGTIISANRQRTDQIDLDFYVQIEVVGVADKITLNSPKYRFVYRDGRARPLEVLEWAVPVTPQPI